jgi:SAM-dependent methyltransferase
VGDAIPARPEGRALHESSRSLFRSVLGYRYLVRYLGGKLLEGSWRELAFPLSEPGRLFLRHGYSAAVMRRIYESDERPQPALDRVFYEYPLHRAVYDRLQLLTHELQHELAARLEHGGRVRVLTGPAGFSYDLFRPLEAIAAADPEALRRVALVAADLDPQGELAPELTARARALGLGDFRLLLGDLTRPELRAAVAEAGPYDLALFVGLSAWLPKPALLQHLRLLRRVVATGGRLISDSFTPAAYALGGHYVGYHASYYPPATYLALLDYCGFPTAGAWVATGRDGINHAVFVPLGKAVTPEAGSRVRSPARARRSPPRPAQE